MLKSQEINIDSLYALILGTLNKEVEDNTIKTHAKNLTHFISNNLPGILPVSVSDIFTDSLYKGMRFIAVAVPTSDLTDQDIFLGNLNSLFGMEVYRSGLSIIEGALVDSQASSEFISNFIRSRTSKDFETLKYC